MATKKQATTEQRPKDDPIPVEDKDVQGMEAAVIAELVRAGVPYADAKKQVLGGKVETPQAVAAPPEDDEPPVIPQKSKDFSDEQVELYNMLSTIEDSNEYEVTVKLPAYIADWTIRKTLQEAARRNDPKFVVENFILLMLKEQRAIDPSKGGKVRSASSGPRDSFNPAKGNWG